MIFNFKGRKDCVTPEHGKCLFNSVNLKRMWWTRRDTSATEQRAKRQFACKRNTNKPAMSFIGNQT